MNILREFDRIRTYVIGTDGTITISLQNSAGEALPVIGATATWRVYASQRRSRERPFKGDALLTKTSAAGQIALSTGLAVITLTDADFADLQGEHWHILQITDSSGNITHMGQGVLFLQRAAA